ncbi:hypothetical protein [Streptomyces sp. S3(2020)]|nr:hypothetical protein [Streptomyces sp. S3(2020)]
MRGRSVGRAVAGLMAAEADTGAQGSLFLRGAAISGLNPKALLLAQHTL